MTLESALQNALHVTVFNSRTDYCVYLNFSFLYLRVLSMSNNTIYYIKIKLLNMNVHNLFTYIYIHVYHIAAVTEIIVICVIVLICVLNQTKRSYAFYRRTRSDWKAVGILYELDRAYIENMHNHCREPSP